MTILDILSGVLLLTGCSLGVIGAIGLIRFPDFYTRMHAAGVTDTLCAGLFF
jgi:multicomponent Na+:H+ antiporter subunit G